MCTSTEIEIDSVAEALRVAEQAVDFLNSPAASDLSGPACGEALVALARIGAKQSAARAGFLRRFDAACAHDADGFRTSSAWLSSKAGLSKKGARAAVREMRLLRERPHLADALAAGDVTDSLAFAIREWTRNLPEDLRAGTDEILLEAARSGASLGDLELIAACAREQWRQQQPDADDPDPDDRSLKLGTTFGGAGVIRGDLTPECAAALQAVLDALGKKQGPEDDRTDRQRYHDALQLACDLLLRARLVPDRAGADTQAVVHIPFSQLRQLPGAADLEEAWLRARLGQPDGSGDGPGDGAYLTGKGAEAAACDAQVVPVVAGSMDLDVIDKIIALARAAVDAGLSAVGLPGGTLPDARLPAAGLPGGTLPAVGLPDAGLPAVGLPDVGRVDALRPGAVRPGSPEARRALRYAIGRLALDLVSGPHGIAAALRTGLLRGPWGSPSLPLDIGASRVIPGQIRRAVQLRDRHCAWPGCDQPPARCDVHHIRHQADGGETSVTNCVLLCQFHHDHLIHRRGWSLILHPDGTTDARSPDGRMVLGGSSPPDSAGQRYL